MKMNLINITLFTELCYDKLNSPEDPFFYIVIHVIKHLVIDDKIFSIHSFQ